MRIYFWWINIDYWELGLNYILFWCSVILFELLFALFIYIDVFYIHACASKWILLQSWYLKCLFKYLISIWCHKIRTVCCLFLYLLWFEPMVYLWLWFILSFLLYLCVYKHLMFADTIPDYSWSFMILVLIPLVIQNQQKLSFELRGA